MTRRSLTILDPRQTLVCLTVFVQVVIIPVCAFIPAVMFLLVPSVLLSHVLVPSVVLPSARPSSFPVGLFRPSSSPHPIRSFRPSASPVCSFYPSPLVIRYNLCPCACTTRYNLWPCVCRTKEMTITTGDFEQILPKSHFQPYSNLCPCKKDHHAEVLRERQKPRCR